MPFLIIKKIDLSAIQKTNLSGFIVLTTYIFGN